MKAKFVNEVNFQRGLDPKTSMGIGVFGDMPKIGDRQEESFDLQKIAKSICVAYNLAIENYTPIDDKSNYNWSKGYQDTFLTMNLRKNDWMIDQFLGQRYSDSIWILLGEDYLPPSKFGIRSNQKKWISQNDSAFEFTGNSTFCHIDAGGYSIPTDFAKQSNISTWLPDYVKDKFIKQAIWDLRYKEPIAKTKHAPTWQHDNRKYGYRIDVKDYINEYNQKDLENLMKQNYMWTTSVKNWKIVKGILEFID
jgi:hypothetical protein